MSQEMAELLAEVGTAAAYRAEMKAARAERVKLAKKRLAAIYCE